MDKRIDQYRLPIERPPDALYIDYIALSALEFWPDNPKIHDEKGLAGSINRWGVVTALLLDERTQLLVAGEGRLRDIRERKRRGQPAPKRIVDHAGEWYLPVMRNVTFDSSEEAEGYLVADNQLTMAGGWDEAGVAEMIGGWGEVSEESLQGTGFDEADVGELFDFITEETGRERRPREPREQSGALFKLLQFVGHHRTIEKTIEMVMAHYEIDRAEAFVKICEVAADNVMEE
jgi:hypothetical protein